MDVIAVMHIFANALNAKNQHPVNRFNRIYELGYKDRDRTQRENLVWVGNEHCNLDRFFQGGVYGKFIRAFFMHLVRGGVSAGPRWDTSNPNERLALFSK